MTENRPLSGVELLVLARLLGARGAITGSRLAKDLEALLPDTSGAPGPVQATFGALARLAERGLVLLGKGKRGGGELTELGRKLVLARLGLEDAERSLDWKTLKSVHLVQRALEQGPCGNGAAPRVRTSSELRAAILRRAVRLPDADRMPLARLRDALAWQELGVETTRPFTTSAVMGHLLGKMLGASREIGAKQALDQLAAKLVGARRPDPNELRSALVRRFVAGEPSTGEGRGNGAAADGLEGFSARVLAAARACTTGRFGDGKVFIAHVRRALGQGGARPPQDEIEFKQRLVAANNAGLLSLSRADLVQAMEPRDVAESEVRDGNATFHFVRI